MPFSISVVFESFKDVKLHLQLGSLGNFFRMKPLKMSLLVMLIRSSELFILSESLPVQDMLMFLWQR